MTDINDVHKIYTNTLHIEDTHLIDVALGTYKAKDVVTDPVWLIPTAPSGFGKTTFIKPYIDLSYDWNNPTRANNAENLKYKIFFMNQITAPTFANTQKGAVNAKDLGHWLADKRSLIVVSDLASIATMDQDNLMRLMGMFRTLFDGYVKADSGGDSKFYKNIKCNMIAFATPSVKGSLDVHSLLGTREISYGLPEMVDKRSAMMITDTPENMQKRSDIVKNFIDDISKQRYLRY